MDWCVGGFLTCCKSRKTKKGSEMCKKKKRTHIKCYSDPKEIQRVLYHFISESWCSGAFDVCEPDIPLNMCLTLGFIPGIWYIFYTWMNTSGNLLEHLLRANCGTESNRLWMRSSRLVFNQVQIHWKKDGFANKTLSPTVLACFSFVSHHQSWLLIIHYKSIVFSCMH